MSEPSDFPKIKMNKKLTIIIIVFFLLLSFAFLIDIANTYWIVSFLINPSSDAVHQQLLKSGNSSFKRLSSILKNTNSMSKSKHWSEIRGNAVVLLAKIDDIKSIEKIVNALQYEQKETVSQYYKPAFMIIEQPGIPALIANLEKGSVEARVNSIIALSAFENDIASDAIIDSLRNDKAFEVRIAAAEALSAYKDTKSIMALIKALKDKEDDVSLSAYYSLILLKDDTARKPIQDFYQTNCWGRYTKRVTHHEIFRFCLEFGNENMRKDALEWLKQHNLDEEDIKDRRKKNPVPGKDFLY